jgi:hypothetical protein
MQRLAITKVNPIPKVRSSAKLARRCAALITAHGLAQTNRAEGKVSICSAGVIMGIVGEWWNELGSKMVIHPQGVDPRIFTGTYHTAVGTGQQRDYTLAGACDAAGGNSQTMGWAVAYDPHDPPQPGEPPHGPSTCAWSGQLQSADNAGSPMEYIVTSWYLTEATDRNDDWESTRSGKDYFFRSKPTATMLGNAMLP